MAYPSPDSPHHGSPTGGEPRRSSLPRLWPSFAVLAVSLVLCVVAYAYVDATVQNEERGRFDAALRLFKNNLSERVDRYADLLLVAKAHIDASPNVTRDSWRTFVASVDLRQRFPGTRSLGYLEHLTPDMLPTHVARMRAEGFLDYAVQPPGDRPEYFPLVYTEPPPDGSTAADALAWQSRGVGMDMWDDPERHGAMAAAADSGQPRATGKVALFLEAGTGSRSGFLMFMPIYRHGASLTSLQERRAALTGFVYAPYRTGTLLRELVEGTRNARLLEFELYDGSVRPENEMFDSRAITNVPTPQSVPATQPATPGALLIEDPAAERTTLQAAGRTWILVAMPSPALTQTADHSLPWLVLLGGTFVSWLLFGVSWLQIRARRISERAASALAASEMRLRASEQLYRLKIEQSPLAVQTLAPDGRTTHVNEAWEQLWGITFDQLGPYNLLTDPELERKGVLPLVHRALAGEVVRVGPIFYDFGELASGVRPRPRWVRSVLYPVKDPLTGAITELVLLHEDFTLRKETEAELRSAKEAAEAANRAKDQFLAVLSHELRNPLAPVLSMVDLLSSGNLPPERSAEAIEVIRRNAELEARLIDDLLDVTRISRGKLHLSREAVDAHLSLEHALEICRSEVASKDLQITRDLAAAKHVVSADPARLQQIFWNLIKNAVKFTPEHGTICLRTRNVAASEGDRMQASDRCDGSLLIEVTDTGIGVAPEKLPRIFDAFEQADGSITRRFGGLGLGLTITRALVEALEGSISVTSEGTGCGTTFTVRLPALGKDALPTAVPPHADLARHDAHGSRRRILLIEDQADARRGMLLLLERDGYEVRAAATAAEALTIARDFPFDLIVSDIGLPDLSGLDLLPQLRAVRFAPAIALTGFGMEQDLQRAATAGFELHITKPVSLDRLRAAIEALLAPLAT